MQNLLKGWWPLVGMSVLLSLLGTGIAMTLSDGVGVTQGSFGRIKEGTSLNEAIVILGDNPFPTVEFRRDPAYVGPIPVQHYTWTDGLAEIDLTFSQEHTVEKKRGSFPTLWERIRWHARQLLDKLYL